MSEEVAAYYTLDGLKSRYELMQHPKVAYALEQIWIAANTNAEDELIDYDEYEVMHRKIILALDPSTPDGDIKEALAEDWVQDSEGHPEGLDRSMRHLSPPAGAATLGLSRTPRARAAPTPSAKQASADR